MVVLILGYALSAKIPQTAGKMIWLFLFQLRNVGEKIRRFVFGKLVKTCREFDNRLPENWSRDGEDLVEKVVSINYDPNRKPMIALTGYNDHLRWQIATSGRIFNL